MMRSPVSKERKKEPRRGGGIQPIQMIGTGNRTENTDEGQKSKEEGG